MESWGDSSLTIDFQPLGTTRALGLMILGVENEGAVFTAWVRDPASLISVTEFTDFDSCTFRIIFLELCEGVLF